MTSDPTREGLINLDLVDTEDVDNTVTNMQQRYDHPISIQALREGAAKRIFPQSLHLKRDLEPPKLELKNIESAST